MKTNIKAQLKNKIKIKMFKMARDPFDISRWNRNFYFRINHEVKKNFYVRFSGSLNERTIGKTSLHIITMYFSTIVLTFIYWWV